MIVCSCNVFNDQAVRAVVMGAGPRPRMSQVYAGLGCRAQCGRCACMVKRIMDETLLPIRNGCAGGVAFEH